MDKGPQEVLRAMTSGTPEQVREALEFQRESFRAKFGCYPEDGAVTKMDDGCEATVDVIGGEDPILIKCGKPVTQITELGYYACEEHGGP